METYLQLTLTAGSSLVRMRGQKFPKSHHVENQIPPLVLFSLCKITAEALLFLKVLQAILVFSLFGALIISRNFFNFFLIFAEILFQEKS